MQQSADFVALHNQVKFSLYII